MDAVGSLGVGQMLLLLLLLLLLAALVTAVGFECVNGFHDTANAVATVISTKSLKPTPAVVWSGIWNFIGVQAGGIGAAFSIVHLPPVDLHVNSTTGRGLAMVLALLPAAIIWNVATWSRGRFASDERGRRHLSAGDWQVGLRYNYRCLDDGEVNDGEVNGVTLGLNWLLNLNARVSFNYDSTFRRFVNMLGGGGGIHGFGTRVAFDL